MKAQRRRLPPGGGDAPLAVDQLQLFQERRSLLQGSGGRRREPREIQRRGRTPERRLQNERRQVCLHDFRGRKAVARFLGAIPAQADAGPQTSGPPLALHGRGRGNLHGLPVVHARAGVKTHPPFEAGIHHRPHPRDREARLGDVGREDDPVRRSRWGCEHPALLFRGKPAVQNGDVRAELRPHPHEFILCLPDLTEPRKENEHVSASLPVEHLPRLEGQSCRTGPGHLAAERRPIEQANGPGASGNGNGGELADRRPQLVRGGCRGHEQDSQVAAKHLPALPGEGQSHVALEVPLVEFIEDHEPVSGKGGIVLDDPGQHPFGNDLEPCCRAHDRLQPGPKPHRPAQPLPEQGRNPFGRGPGRYPAGLEQEELRSGKSLVGKEAPGDERRFAGARLGMEHEQIARRQRLGDLIEMGIERQGGDFIRDHGILKNFSEKLVGGSLSVD